MVLTSGLEPPISCTQNRCLNQVGLRQDKLVRMVGFAPTTTAIQMQHSTRLNYILIKFMVCDYLILFPNDIVDKSLFLQFIETLHH